MKEGGGGEGDGKGAEEKLKRLRKRNAELAALAGQLNEKIRSLKMENEQLVDNPPHPCLSPSLLYSLSLFLPLSPFLFTWKQYNV